MEKNDPVNDYHYQEFVERFKNMSDEELIDAFNSDVGKNGWVPARASFHAALRGEFENRSYDYSAIGGKGYLFLNRRIKLVGKKVLIK
jgi:hypothetical protein